MFDDIEGDPEKEDETKNLIEKTPMQGPFDKKVFGDDDSVAQLDKQSSVASMKPGEVDRLSMPSGSASNLRRGGSKSRFKSKKSPKSGPGASKTKLSDDII